MSEPFPVAPGAGPATVRPVSHDSDRTSVAAAPGVFPETRWTLLDEVRAGGNRRDRALEELCARYWFPLYTWLRRSGRPHADAEDCVQSVLGRLSAGEAFAGLEREGGRLRSWLLQVVKNHVTSEWRRGHAERRGGFQHAVDDADARYANLADPGETPDAAFDRQWALGILDRALAALRRHHAEAGREAWFTALQPALLQTGAHVRFATIAAGLGISEGQARVTAFRMRRHLRQLIEAEILLQAGSETAARAEMDVFRRALLPPGTPLPPQ